MRKALYNAGNLLDAILTIVFYESRLFHNAGALCGVEIYRHATFFYSTSGNNAGNLITAHCFEES